MSNTLLNRFLFSHLYLERLCRDASDRTESANLMADLRGWLPDWDDSSLSSLINTQVEPALVDLDFYYEQLSDDPHSLRLYSTYRRETPIGLCYVAHPQGDHDGLDSTVKGRHYAAKIIQALREEELSWGLLTDGQHWRLYHADELAPYETYLEIDLEQVLRDEGNGEMEDAALLFHLLFRESAFAPDEAGKCELDRHLSCSEEATAGIEEHLSDCIEDVLRRLCQGFIERDGRDTYTPEQRDEVFFNATVLLYRMLFILYAEARELLPLGDPTYDPVSLDALMERAIDCTRGSGMPDPDATGLWQDLLDLCSWINSGDEERHIPCYNGNLFDDSDKRYIHDHTIADKYQAQALFSLGCIEADTPEGYRRIDYRDLSVRHLGSIYEGLLEYKLFITQEKRVKRSDGKGGFAFPKLSETTLKKGEEQSVVKVGQVYFAHSAGERKAMGVYYTPEYIVDYIVKQTVRRGLEERREELEEKLPGWLEEVETAVLLERTRLQQFVDEKLVEFVEEEVLTFRVCDPAMGSGHFLVNAAHTITDFVVETLNLTPWENPNLKADSDPMTWRRRVAKHCLYGVDLNPLAVELAKLSLWLTTVAEGKPLSFLDHHLRPGNSLIGARLENLEVALGGEEEPAERKPGEAVQLSMLKEFGFQERVREAVDILAEISARLADERGDVADQAIDYERAREALAPYRRLADLLTARHFGVEVDKCELSKIAEYIVERSEKEPSHWASIGSRFREVTSSRCFFHWDLEFPRVFIDLEQGSCRQNPGFDAVMGNPPYLRQERLGEDKDYFEATYEVHDSAADLYVYFYERSHELLRQDGRFGMITSNKFMRSRYGEKLRDYLIGNHHIELIVDFGELPVFSNAATFPAILITRAKCLQGSSNHSAAGRSTAFAQIQTLDFSNLEAAVKEQEKSLPPTAFEGYNWSLADAASLAILEKMKAVRVPLDEYVGGMIRRGVLTGFNEAFIIDREKRDELIAKDPKSAEIIKPLIMGTDIRRYRINFRGRYLIWTYVGVPIERYPAIFNHLKKYETQLKIRLDKGQHWWELRPCDYYSDFERPKIVWGAFALEGRFVLDRQGFWVSAPAYFVPRDDPYLAAILSSRLGFFILSHMCSVLGDASRGGRAVIRTTYIRPLPIRRVFSTTSASERERLKADLIAQYNSGNFSALLNNVSALLPQDKDGSFLAFAKGASGSEEKSDVVHDLLAYLAEQMIDLNKERQRLKRQFDLFRFVDRDLPLVRFDEAFVLDESRRPDEEMDLAAVHHDIEGLRLTPNKDGTWTLELQAKFRDPEQEWREWIKGESGQMIKRQWVPAYRLRMKPQKARFYRYALPRLQDFDSARSFPGGRTRSTLQKLHLTRVPIPPHVDLSKLARLDRELADTRRKIELTDDLIDQIVYKLYGLTEEEIAIVEGRA